MWNYLCAFSWAVLGIQGHLIWGLGNGSEDALPKTLKFCDAGAEKASGTVEEVDGAQQ